MPREKPVPGLHPLGLSSGRDGFIYIPAPYTSAKPSPLVVLLHGAGQDSTEWARPELSQLLDPGSVVGIIPDSRFPTWDMIYSDFGPDVRFIDQALALAFRQCSIDPKKIAVGGFSDGATYALSLGITHTVTLDEAKKGIAWFLEG